MSTTIDYLDLFDLGYRDGELDPATGALDCKGVVIEVMRRNGKDVHPSTFHPGSLSWLEVSMSSIRALDVIVSDPGREGLSSHLSIAIDDNIRGDALTADRRRGVTLVPILRIRNVVGVYRFVG